MAKRRREALSAYPATGLSPPQRNGLLPLIGALVLLALAVASTSLMRALMRMTKEA